MQRCMIERAEQMILLCDHTKFTRLGHLTLAALPEIKTMITDTPLPRAWAGGNGRGSFDHGQAVNNAEAIGNARGTWPFRWTGRGLEGLRRRPMQRIVPKDAETWAAV